MPTSIKNSGSRWLTLGLALVLSASISAPVFAAQQRGGAAPRGGARGGDAPAANNGANTNRGGARGDGSAAQARQQIQAARKAAIDRANQQLQLAMLAAKADQSSTDPNARAQAKAVVQAAQAAKKQAIEKANADAKAAAAALGNGK